MNAAEGTYDGSNPDMDINSHPKLNRSTARRRAIATLIGLPLIPLCGFAMGAPPDMVFGLGAIAFFFSALGLVGLVAAVSIVPVRPRSLGGSHPLGGSPPFAVSQPVMRFHFTIRHLVCLMIFVFGMTIFIVSAFRCEAAERAIRPKRLPTSAMRQFVWEQESGLVCVTLAGLIWIGSALKLERPRIAT
jgi:hypothetical protein